MTPTRENDDAGDVRFAPSNEAMLAEIAARHKHVAIVGVTFFPDAPAAGAVGVAGVPSIALVLMARQLLVTAAAQWGELSLAGAAVDGVIAKIDAIFGDDDAGGRLQ